MGGKKRIVLYDTLCEMLDPREVEAVLAHELGHFKRRHVRKHLIAASAWALAGLAVFQALVNQAWFYAGLGVEHPSHHAGLLLFLWVAPLFTFPLNPLWSAWSRRHEYEADAFAAEYAEAPALVRALVKMYVENAATLTPDPLHSSPALQVPLP